MSTLERTLHQRPLELAAAAVDGFLTPVDAAELDAHLAGCPVCAGRAGAMHGDALALDQPLDLLPSRRVDDAVLASIAGTSRRQLRGQLVLVAAAILMLASVGLALVGAYLLRPQEPIPTTVNPSEPPALQSPVPSSAPQVALDLERVGTVPVSAEFFGAEASALREIAAIPAAYVGVGAGQSVQRSEDGLSWTAIELPFEASKSRYGQDLDYSVNDIASNGSRLVIVGAYSHEPCTRPAGDVGAGPLCPVSPISWVSEDGRTWRSSHPWAGPEPPAGYEQGSEFTAVWPVPTGGWDATLSFWQGESLTGREIWHSDDGIAWAPLEPMPVPAGRSATEWPFERGGVADTEGRRLAWERWVEYNEVGGCPCLDVTSLATSIDGRTWQPIETFPSSGAMVTAALAPGQGGSNLWILVGSSTSDGGTTYEPTIWVSEDLAEWTTVDLPTPPPPSPEFCTDPSEADTPCLDVNQVAAISHHGSGYVAIGMVVDELYGSARSVIWWSPDGRTWSVSGSPAAGIGALADGPAGLIGVGVPDRENTIATWLIGAEP